MSIKGLLDIFGAPSDLSSEKAMWIAGRAGGNEYRTMANSPNKQPELSSRLRKTNEELKNLQNSVKTGMINVEVLMDFRTATERAREAGAAV